MENMNIIKIVSLTNRLKIVSFENSNKCMKCY